MVCPRTRLMRSCRADSCRPCLHSPRAHSVSACGAKTSVAEPEVLNTASGNRVPLTAAFSPALSRVRVDATVIDTTSAEDTVTPTGTTVKATAAHPIVLEVIGDDVDRLHPHSIPEHTCGVQATPGQAFKFTDDLPGRGDVGLHDVHRAATTVQVQL